MIVRSVNISNAALELLLGLAFIHVLWRADAERDGRRLLGAGVLLGLGLLTKTTLVYLAPLLVVVAARHAWHGRSRRWRPLATALVTLALPLALMAPWFAFNKLQFGTLTTNAQARDQQRFDSYGRTYHYTANLAKRDLPLLLNPFEPQEWQYQTGLSHPALFTGFDFLRVSLFGAPLLLLLAAPRWLRSRHTALLLGPWLLAVVLLAVSSVGANWSIMLPRYTYPVLPGIALYGAVAWRRLGREERVPLAVLSATLVVLAATWVYAASDFLL